METATLFTLPAQPLPSMDKRDNIFMTVWLVLCLVLGYYIQREVLRPSSTATEFRTICIGIWLLVTWYIAMVVDGWMHYDNLAVGYYYIILLTIWESLRVTSAVFFCWGTYKVIWTDLQPRFEKVEDSHEERRWHQGHWWFVAKCAIFLVCLVSIYYVGLYIALGVVWLLFRSLNSIADIATKRTQFEISVAAMLSGFTLLTFTAGTFAFTWRARKYDGQPLIRDRIFIWLASALLFARSVLEFVICILIWLPAYTRQGTSLVRDISYGAITVVYLLMIFYSAKSQTSPSNKGSDNVRNIQSNIRIYIIERLQSDTNEGRTKAPPFREILERVRMSLDTPPTNDTLFSGSTLTKHEDNRRIAIDYIGTLREKYKGLDPKPVAPPQSTTPSTRPQSTASTSRFSFLTGGRQSKGPSVKGSNSNLKSNSSSHSSPTASSPRNSTPGQARAGLSRQNSQMTQDGTETESIYSRTTFASGAPQNATSRPYQRYATDPLQMLGALPEHREPPIEMGPIGRDNPRGSPNQRQPLHTARRALSASALNEPPSIPHELSAGFPYVPYNPVTHRQPGPSGGPHIATAVSDSTLQTHYSQTQTGQSSGRWGGQYAGQTTQATHYTMPAMPNQSSPVHVFGGSPVEREQQQFQQGEQLTSRGSWQAQSWEIPRRPPHQYAPQGAQPPAIPTQSRPAYASAGPSPTESLQVPRNTQGEQQHISLRPAPPVPRSGQRIPRVNMNISVGSQGSQQSSQNAP